VLVASTEFWWVAGDLLVPPTDLVVPSADLFAWVGLLVVSWAYSVSAAALFLVISGAVRIDLGVVLDHLVRPLSRLVVVEMTLTDVDRHFPGADGESAASDPPRKVGRHATGRSA
jgi:hypothetical protein